MNTAKLIYASSDDTNMLYATGIFVPDPYLYLEHSGNKILVMSDLEYERARKQCKACTVLPLRDYKEKLKDDGKKPSLENIVDLLLRERGISEIEVPGNFPSWLYQKLLDMNHNVMCVDGAFFPQRELKSKTEQKYHEDVQRINEGALELALDIISNAAVRGGGLYHKSAPLTSEIMKRELNKYYLDHDCTCPDGMIVSCGSQTALPHHRGTGLLKANTPIILDLFPRSIDSGHWADMTRTVVKGKASDTLKKMYDAVLESQEKALSMICDGILGSTVHTEVLKVLESYGFKTEVVNGTPTGMIHTTGHGLGLDIHENPRIGPATDNEKPLKAGQIVTVEPGLYYPKEGGVRIEDFVVVTKKGYKNFTKAKKFLEIL